MDDQVIVASYKRTSQAATLRHRFEPKEASRSAGAQNVAAEHNPRRHCTTIPIISINEDVYESSWRGNQSSLTAVGPLNSRLVDGPLASKQEGAGVGGSIPCLCVVGLLGSIIGIGLGGPMLGVLVGGVVLVCSFVRLMLQDCNQHPLPTILLGPPVGWAGTALVPRNADGTMVDLQQEAVVAEIG